LRVVKKKINKHIGLDQNIQLEFNKRLQAFSCLFVINKPIAQPRLELDARLHQAFVENVVYLERPGAEYVLDCETGVLVKRMWVVMNATTQTGVELDCVDEENEIVVGEEVFVVEKVLDEAVAEQLRGLDDSDGRRGGVVEGRIGRKGDRVFGCLLLKDMAVLVDVELDTG
jgi:hypothetical protein